MNEITYEQALESYLIAHGHAISEGDVTEEELKDRFDQEWAEAQTEKDNKE